MSTAAQRSRSAERAAWFDSTPHRTGLQPGHRFWLLFGGRAEAGTQVRRHLSPPRALPLPYLTHSGPSMQWRALTLLFGCPAACRLSSGRPRAGHAAAPA